MKAPAYTTALDMQSILILTILSSFICSAAAFTLHQSHQKHDMPGKTTDTVEQPEPNFHVVLQRIGKTVLRPGGSAATKRAQALANIHPGDTVLVLSAGLGKSGIELAENYGAKVTLTDLDTSRLEKSEALINKLGLSDQITVKQADMFKIDSSLGTDAKFDVAQLEASLTHYPRSRKAKFFHDVAKHSKKFILHEIFLKTDNKELQDSIKKEMSKVLNIGFIPETKDIWQSLLSDAGFAVEHVSTGDLALLNPNSLLKDEGVLGFTNIAFNVATQPYLRKRMLATKSAISRHSKDLGYITIVASKK